MTTDVGPNAALEAVGACPRQQIGRPVKALSYEVAHHVKAFLDHKHYEQGYTFLQSLLTSGSSISVPAKPYVGLLAPVAQLALASTLVVYPPTTTKAVSPEARKGSDAALRYLHSVHGTVRGPGYNHIREAFAFADGRRRGAANRSAHDSPSADLNHLQNMDVEHLEASAANAQSLWQLAEDFWHVVGWAFNCSLLHKKRWERWKLWLDVTLDFLETDWKDCVELAARYPDEDVEILQESLIWRYISSQDSSVSTTRRRILKALLAVGHSSHLQQYPEVWDNETAEVKKAVSTKHSFGAVDFEQENTGDYVSDDEDIVMAGTARSAPRSRRSKNIIESSLPSLEDPFAGSYEEAVQRLGGVEALDLRQRFLALLAKVAQQLPTDFTSLDSLSDTLVEQARYFSLPILSAIITTSHLPPLSKLTFVVNLIIPLTAKRYPDYTCIAPTQADFEIMFLPHRAHTQSYAANAKLSLLLEQVTVYMLSESLLTPTDSLRKAMEVGIEKRGKVHGIGGMKARAQEEEHGKLFLLTSAQRLLGLLDVLEMQDGRAPRPRTETGGVDASFGSELSSVPPSDTDDEG